MKKRDFIKGSIGMGTVLALPTGAFAKVGIASTRTYVVFDQKYADARLFAAKLEQQNVPSYETGLDIGQLWYRVLRERIRGENARIIGMTTASDLLVIQDFAREFQLKLQYKGIHNRRSKKPSSRKTIHTLSYLNNDNGTLFPLVQQAGVRWPSSLATVLNNASWAEFYNGSGADLMSEVQVIETITSSDHPGVLVSWVLGN